MPDDLSRPSPEIGAVIRRWFNTHIHDSPVARSVDAYNHLRAALHRLEADLAAAFAKEE